MAEPTILRLDDPSDSLKMLRETLSAVQNGAAGVTRYQHAARIGRIIAEIDRQRPLGPDGKHGNQHTPTCGCSAETGADADRVAFRATYLVSSRQSGRTQQFIDSLLEQARDGGVQLEIVEPQGESSDAQLLAGARAEAWDSGYEAGAEDQAECEGHRYRDTPEMRERGFNHWRKNPHRTEPQPMEMVDERDPDCVKAWPDCFTFGYDPACCRFPKSCSAGVTRLVPIEQEGGD